MAFFYKIIALVFLKGRRWNDWDLLFALGF